MQKEVNYATVFSVLALVAVLCFGIAGVATISSGFKGLGEKVSNIDIDEQAIANAIVAGIEVPDYPDFPDYMLSEEEYEDKVSEDKAEELAMNYINDEDFLDELASYFVAGTWTEFDDMDADDLTFSILDTDVDWDIGEDYTVTLDIKVYEDEDKIAKVKGIVFTVKDVDYDDDFDDAELFELAPDKYADFTGVTTTVY